MADLYHRRLEVFVAVMGAVENARRFGAEAELGTFQKAISKAVTAPVPTLKEVEDTLGFMASPLLGLVGRTADGQRYEAREPLEVVIKRLGDLHLMCISGLEDDDEDD
ncbi:hypothetical protein [Nocardia sp. IFM 10818]